MVDRISKKESDDIYILKAIAIYSAILAHTTYYEIENFYGMYFLARFARMGVFTFFFLSGYLFKKKKIGTFFSKSVTNLIIPWLIIGSALYTLQLRIGIEFTFLKFINYLIGNGSTLYFCTMLFIIKLLFNIVISDNNRRNNKICKIFIITNIVSIFLTAIGVLPQNSIRELNFWEYLNPYLNIFNWIGIYSLGFVFRKNEILNGNSIQKRKWMIVSLGLCTLILGMFESKYSYWSFGGIYCELSLFLITYLIVISIKNSSVRKVLTCIGKNTYPIFLMHYPILSLFCNVSFLSDSFIFGVFRPIICILVMMLLFLFTIKISEKLKIKNIVMTLTGIRL